MGGWTGWYLQKTKLETGTLLQESTGSPTLPFTSNFLHSFVYQYTEPLFRYNEIQCFELILRTWHFHPPNAASGKICRHIILHGQQMFHFYNEIFSKEVWRSHVLLLPLGWYIQYWQMLSILLRTSSTLLFIKNFLIKIPFCNGCRIINKN